MQDIAKYIGIPFEERGRREALDCWGLVRRFYWEVFDIGLPLLNTYRDTKDQKTIEKIVKGEEVESVWKEIENGQHKYGDILIFLINGVPSHIGMVVDKNRMLHIEKGIDSCIERFDGMRWKKRLYKIYRHKGLN